MQLTQRLLFILMLGAFNASAVTVVLEWDRNSEPNVAGYRVYSGAESRSYSLVSEVGNITAETNNFTLGTNFLAVTAYDTDGLESPFSDELVLVIVAPPVLRFESNTLAWTGTGSYRVRWSNDTGTNTQTFSSNRIALAMFPANSTIEVRRYDLGTTNVLSAWSEPLRYQPPTAPRTLQIRVSLQRSEAMDRPFAEFAQVFFHDAASEQGFYRAQLQIIPTGMRIR